MPDKEQGISLITYFENLIKNLENNIENRINDLKEYHDKDVNDLRHHRDEMTKNLREFLEQQLDTIDKSTRDKAAAMDKRLEGMNELRGAMKDQVALFAERKEVIAIKENLEKDIRVLRESKAELRGKAEQGSVIVAIIIAVVGIIISVIGFVVKTGLL